MAHLNLHGGKQELCINYFEIYPPVAAWMAIHFLLVVATLNSWFLRQVDFVMAYTQASIECEMYMTLPQGVLTLFGCAKIYALHFMDNIYRQKQVGLVWYSHIHDQLQGIGFQPLKSDEYVFVWGKCIFMSPDKILIDKVIKDLIADRLNI